MFPIPEPPCTMDTAELYRSLFGQIRGLDGADSVSGNEDGSDSHNTDKNDSGTGTDSEAL